MTLLSSHFPRIRPSYPSHLKLLSYILVFLMCIGCAGGSSKDQPTVSIADLREQLQPLRQIGVYAGSDPKTGILYMGNDSIERWLRLNQGSHKLQTIRYTHTPSGENYVDRPSEEFRFQIGEIVFSGDSDLLTYDDYRIVQKMGGGKRVSIQFTYTSDTEARPTFYLWVHYEIYPDSPVIHKWLTVQNLTDSAFFVEDMVIESLPMFAGRGDRLQIWRSGLSGVDAPLSSPWAGGGSETFILAGDPNINRGVVLGNRAPGLLKYYAVHSDRETVSIGLTSTAGINGIEIRVPSSQSVDSPKVSTMLVAGDFQSAIQKVTHRDIGRQIPEIQWLSLNTECETSIELMRPGGLTAVDYDWNIEDLQTVKQIGRRAHENGGKFGVRLPIAEIRTTVLDRPAWQLAAAPVVQWRSTQERSDAEEATEEGDEVEQPAAHEAAPVMIYCVLSDYGYYLTQAVKGLLEETRADILIFDLPILGSQDSLLKGCSALGHQHYTRAESIGMIYQWLFGFADYLHQEYPALQLGITASAYGVEQPDAACLAHFDFFLQ